MADGQNLTKKVEQAQSFQDRDKIGDAMRLYEEVVNTKVTGDEVTDEVVKAKEAATYKLA